MAGEQVALDPAVVSSLNQILVGLTAPPDLSLREATEGLAASLIAQLFTEHSKIKRPESQMRIAQFG